MVWERLGSASVGGGVANNSWKELARATAGSGGSSSLTTAAFTPKENMMILYNSIGADAQIRVGSGGTIDTGGNYATRYSEDGGSDSSFTSSPHNAYWFASGGAGASGSEHGMGFIEGINLSSFEKLFMGNHADNADGTGASNTVGRYERAMKWSNTSAQINIVRMYSSGTMAEGSEIVVLGCDNDEADTGSNFWQELATVELSSAGDSIDISSFTAKKWLFMVWKTDHVSGNTDDIYCKFNGDGGSNYGYRRDAGSSDETFTSTDKMRIDAANGAYTRDGFMIIRNLADKEKILYMQDVIENGSGASAAPRYIEAVGKWANTSAQISDIELINQGSGDFKIGSTMKIYGAD